MTRAAPHPAPDATSAPVVDVAGITKAFDGRVVVDDVSLRVEAGEIYGFLGPNGSGKTTFLRVLCGLLRADAGSGTCLGFDVRRESDAIKRRVGYMTQRFGWYEDLRVRENLDFVARLYGVADRRAAVRAALERHGLAERADQLAGQLSGGWKQRLALAACMLHRPRLLLLDEPTAGVDPSARREFWDRIHELAAEGLTVLITTHYMDEAERCHRLAYLSAGRLIARGTVERIVAEAGLVTYEVTGADPGAAARRLRDCPAIEQVVPFGAALHVSGRDRAALEAALGARLGADARWRPHATGLEDVFVHLMRTEDAGR